MRESTPDIDAFDFDATPRALLTVTAEQLGGSGRVTSGPAGITCRITCNARFDPDTMVALAAKPDRGSRFVSGAKIRKEPVEPWLVNSIDQPGKSPQEQGKTATTVPVPACPGSSA